MYSRDFEAHMDMHPLTDLDIYNHNQACSSPYFE